MPTEKKYGTYGVKYPFQFTPEGHVASATVDLRENNLDKINMALEQIILTIPGTRMFRPEWGGSLPGRMFIPNHPSKLALWARDLKKLIERYEPRISIENVQFPKVTPQEKERGIAKIKIQYRILGQEFLNEAMIKNNKGALSITFG